MRTESSETRPAWTLALGEPGHADQRPILPRGPNPSSADRPSVVDGRLPLRSPRADLAALLLGDLPVRLVAQVITAVCIGLSMLMVMLLGAIAETDLGPVIREILVATVAVPCIVVLPVVSVVLRQLREIRSQRDRAVAASDTDLLTGIANRRRIQSLLGRDLTLARRNRTALTLALLDIDDFKSVNDTHGHEVGDQLLTAVAAACDRAMRTSDAVGRWGGEEFVVVMPGTDLAGASIALERLRAAVAQVEVRLASGASIRRTASIGAVVIEPIVERLPSIEPAAVVSIADRAMYRAKQRGKNTVCLEVLGMEL